ncbi:hypothetical protein E5Q_05819 [Mixia osmundae IAM 14324]|uniref:Eukaryotic translation initiation factor 2A n=1 Tax=Mixia osmundae (strain CBS 9802 / IAM 14324 / JCM 22182 / KY 12970) TaxID=764103 RepID=G7E8G9_MIXOS|nr:hypothetical protein E5Q_05819 [Mixia osmundae IAM 14324]
MSACQYSYRSLRALGVCNGPPEYSDVSAFQRPAGTTRNFAWSSDGSTFAYAESNSVTVTRADSHEVLCTVDVPAVVTVALSPKGSFFSTWERMVKTADGSQHKNLRVWSTNTGQEVASFTQKSYDGWDLQYTEDEMRAVRCVANEVHIYDTSDFTKGIADKLRADGVAAVSLSRGRNPSVAVFVPESKGAPASLRTHHLETLSSVNAQKTFYKADKVQIKWNQSGTMLLFLTQTDVDKTGKSYYGETGLYLMSASGAFDCRVTLDREGTIHDFTWSPNDKEFVVTYGYMPAKTTIFDHRVNVVHDFGISPRNFVAFNPQGRLLCLAGFGNLAGEIDIYDRKTLKKLTTFDAPNTSTCQWSPDGRYLLCATLSPRLRVDNGIKLFHHTGALVHVQDMEELYQAGWRPADASLFPFRQSLSPAPAPSAQYASSTPTKPPVKAMGAYRPPGARGQPASNLFKREDEGGEPHVFQASPARNEPIEFGPRKPRTIPGMAPKDATQSNQENGKSKKKKEPKTPRPNRRNGTEDPDSSFLAPDTGPNSPAPSTGPATPARASTPSTPMRPPAVQALNDSNNNIVSLSPEDKKRRALTKKLSSIQQLKDRRARGEKLELTQIQKISAEPDVVKELKELAALDLNGKA